MLLANSPLKRWAIIECPKGTKNPPLASFLAPRELHGDRSNTVRHGICAETFLTEYKKDGHSRPVSARFLRYNDDRLKSGHQIVLLGQSGKAPDRPDHSMRLVIV